MSEDVWGEPSGEYTGMGFSVNQIEQWVPVAARYIYASWEVLFATLDDGEWRFESVTLPLGYTDKRYDAETLELRDADE